MEKGASLFRTRPHSGLNALASLFQMADETQCGVNDTGGNARNYAQSQALAVVTIAEGMPSLNSCKPREIGANGDTRTGLYSANAALTR